MKKKLRITALDGFLAGAIVMALITGYNRSSMPIAIVCLIASILCRD